MENYMLDKARGWKSMLEVHYKHIMIHDHGAGWAKLNVAYHIWIEISGGIKSNLFVLFNNPPIKIETQLLFQDELIIFDWKNLIYHGNKEKRGFAISTLFLSI